MSAEGAIAPAGDEPPLAERIDAAAGGIVVVFGSLPPAARDLDLLCRPGERARVSAWLAEEGFDRRGETWARFRGCRVDVVDLVPAGRWGLPEPAERALFGEARPISGFANLRRPAPHHVLLILAKRVVREGRLDERRRARLEEALADDVAAWRRAREAAGAWGAGPALDLLAAARRGEPLSPSARAGALATLQARGRPGPLVLLRAWRTVLRPGGRGAVVSLSGLDGAGKTSQATALRDALAVLGRPAEVHWSRIAQAPSLDRVAGPAKRVVRRVAGRRSPAAPWPAPGAEDSVDPAKALRQRSALLTHLWATVVAIENGLAHRRGTARPIRRGRVVICDRYVLDSAAHLRRRYGEHRRFRFQLFLIRLLSPRPVRAYLLEVAPETSMARKKEHYTLDQLRQHARLYRQEQERLGAVRLDGERPRGELCEAIARDVWRHLR